MSSFNKRRKPKYTYRYAKQGAEASLVFLVITLITVIIVLSAILVSRFADAQEQDAGSDGDTAKPTTDLRQTEEQTAEATTEDEKTEQPVPDGYTTVTVSKTQISRGSLVLVNTQYAYDDEQLDRNKLVSLYGNNDKKYTLAYSDLRLLSSAYEALNSMTDDYYKATGKSNLQLVQAYRSRDEQEKYYNDSVENIEDRKYYEKAGYSDHQTGLGFNVKLYENDVSMSYSKYASEYAKWIADNFHKYGFIIRYLPEKYEITGIYDESSHFRYVGVPHSYYMVQHSLCLDEYIYLIRKYTLGSETLEVECDGVKYRVYYVKASDSESTEVYVPTDKEYEISGNNVDGFIVWYKA